MAELYDAIGRTYSEFRRADSRIADAIERALGDARTVVNVGAGTGSYEPAAREVVAVEPSQTMIDQRPPGSAPAVRARAEALPFADREFDAAMAVLSDHHWPDRAAGLAEMRRIASRRVVFTWDCAAVRDSWIVRDYMPEFAELAANGMAIEEIAEHLGADRIEPVPIPHDCADGFLHAYWRRPQAYLDPAVRACISVFALLDASDGLRRLAADLKTGEWHRRNAGILDLTELDLGYRLVVGSGG
jgi:SAM-dependent methyltransferase